MRLALVLGRCHMSSTSSVILHESGPQCTHSHTLEDVVPASDLDVSGQGSVDVRGPQSSGRCELAGKSVQSPVGVRKKGVGKVEVEKQGPGLARLGGKCAS